MYPAVSDADLLAAAIALPPLPEQRRITANIDSLSCKSKRAREQLDHIPRLVEKYKQAVLAAAFGRLTHAWRATNRIVDDANTFFARRQSSHEVSRSEKSLGRDERASQITLDDDLREELGELSRTNALPNGWSWSALGFLFGVYVGATPSRKVPAYWNGGVPWVSSGEVAFCRIGSTHETISEEGLQQSSTRLPPADTVLLGMPPLEAVEIVRCIEAAFGWIDRLAGEATSARKLINRLDQAVLAKAFRGELVPQDPTDEPSNMLLERIRAAKARPTTRPPRKRRS